MLDHMSAQKTAFCPLCILMKAQKWLHVCCQVKTESGNINPWTGLCIHCVTLGRFDALAAMMSLSYLWIEHKTVHWECLVHVLGSPCDTKNFVILFDTEVPTYPHCKDEYGQ